MGNESWLVCKLRDRIAELERDLQQERNASNRSVALLMAGEALREKTTVRAIIGGSFTGGAKLEGTRWRTAGIVKE